MCCSSLLSEATIPSRLEKDADSPVDRLRADLCHGDCLAILPSGEVQHVHIGIPELRVILVDGRHPFKDVTRRINMRPGMRADRQAMDDTEMVSVVRGLVYFRTGMPGKIYWNIRPYRVC